MARNRTAFEKQTFRLLQEFESAVRSTEAGDGDVAKLEETKAALVKRLQELHTTRRRLEKLRRNLSEIY